MNRGESVKVLVDYDLFDINIKDCRGIYLKTTPSSGKLLIYFPINQEWAELLPEDVERIDPQNIPEDNKSFVDRVKV